MFLFIIVYYEIEIVSFCNVLCLGIGLRDTRELEGMASKPVNEHMFNVQEFDELTGLVDTIFAGGEDCGTFLLYKPLRIF